MCQRADLPERCRGRALTLVELLAVLVIASLVAGLGVQGLASSHDAASFRKAKAIVHDLDRHARLLARTHGPVRMTVVEHGQALAIAIGDSLEPSIRISLPKTVTVEMQPIDDAVGVLFDCAARSEDYQIVVRSESRAERWHVSGLTGWMNDSTGGAVP